MYKAKPDRYEKMKYNRCGKSGLKLPAISLGLWQNFGSADPLDNAREMVLTAFDLGITHFDLANNYGPQPGTAEENFGKIFKDDLAKYRNELVISTKAGYRMWPGPYGEWGSRKYLLGSLDESLQRMGLDYVDIFYSHQPDPDTPLEETMSALDTAVKQGKALYVGISSYQPDMTREAIDILESMGTKCLIHQPNYSMLSRWIEDGLLDVLDEKGVGCIAFCPLAQGQLTDKYLNGVPQDSRASKHRTSLSEDKITAEKVEKIRKLNEIAKKLDMSMAQLALAWVLRDERVTSALIGASRVEHIIENVKMLEKPQLDDAVINELDKVLAG